MPRGRKKKPWWEEPPQPRKPHRDEQEEAEVKAVTGELPEDCEAVKAYHAGADTAPLSHLLPSDRPDLLQRLLRAIDEGNARHWERTRHLLYMRREGEPANLNSTSETPKASSRETRRFLVAYRNPDMLNN